MEGRFSCRPLAGDFLVACSSVLLFDSVAGKCTVGTPSPLTPLIGDKKVAAPDLLYSLAESIQDFERRPLTECERLLDLENRTALMVGTKRVGAVVARRLAQAGVRLALSYRGSKRAAQQPPGGVGADDPDLPGPGRREPAGRPSSGCCKRSARNSGTSPFSSTWRRDSRGLPWIRWMLPRGKRRSRRPGPTISWRSTPPAACAGTRDRPGDT